MKSLNIKKWKSDKNIKSIFSILNIKNEETRFIGGCLRNLILKKESDDIDLATTIIPQKVLQLLKEKKIKTITSGIKHGTVIAIINNKKIEITTLRKDIKTDGRHAKVKFTKDWVIDSNRRDFTINALSCDFNGKLYDYHNGLNDIKKASISIAVDSVKKAISTSVDKSKLDNLFSKNLEQTKSLLKKINS